MIEQAQQLATRAHEGQVRKNGPAYITHPAAVVDHLREYGITDRETLAAGWLHDVVEDTSVGQAEINAQFGINVGQYVAVLTRDVSEQAYKDRLAQSPQGAIDVKLCDVLHNIATLESLSPAGIQRKVRDCYTFYIPLARKTRPRIAEALEQTLLDYYERTSLQA